MKSEILLILTAFASAVSEAMEFHEECRQTLDDGRQRIENVAPILASREIDRLSKLKSEWAQNIIDYNDERILLTPTLQDMLKIRDDQTVCPQPNNTKSTTTTPSDEDTTTTPFEEDTSTTPSEEDTSTTPSEEDTTTDASGSTDSPTSTSEEASSSTSPDAQEDMVMKRGKNDVFSPKKVYVTRTNDQDPFEWYMKTLHYYMKRESDVCNNQITDLNSITEDQLFGYFSTLAAAHPGPFCSLCHRFSEEVHSKVLKPNTLLIRDDDYHLSHALYNHIPSPKTFCTAIAPGCDEDYALKIGNLTESVVCLECTACMAVTNVLQHKVLLQPKIVDRVYNWLRGNLFYNLCAEICLKLENRTIPLFPNGFTYDGCQNVLKAKFYVLIEVATVILRPERFCSLETQWCELNEQPNALHCLRELCQEYFKNTPQTRWLCSQIPDRPDQADAFLNIRQTKVKKEKKEYHLKFEQRNLHDEL